jgi:hypothetical protein
MSGESKKFPQKELHKIFCETGYSFVGNDKKEVERALKRIL